MAGCELNIAPAFVGAPTTHHRHIHRDAIVTSADDFDATVRRHRTVTDADDATGSRASMIPPHYRLVPCSLAQSTAGSEWVTLSKSVLLQLVERICQLSFQADSLPSVPAASAEVTDRSSSPHQPLYETLIDAAESSDATETQLPQAECPPDIDTFPSRSEVDYTETNESADVLPAAKEQSDIRDVPASEKTIVVPGDEDMRSSINVNSGAGTHETDCDRDDNDTAAEFAANAPMLEAISDNSSLSSNMSSAVTIPDNSVVCPVPSASTPQPVRSVSARSRPDRRRRLRELRRLRRHQQQSAAMTADNQHQPQQLYDRGRRRDAVVRRRFAVPRQLPPPCPRDRRSASDADGRLYGACTEVHASVSRLSVGRRRHGHVFQPWSALNKVVVCQLIDVVLSQELLPMSAAWRPATTMSTSDKRRSSGTIWNPAISPVTRESDGRIPQQHQQSPTVEDVPSVDSSFLAGAAPSSLLHTLLGPMAAATSYLDRRRSETSAVDAADVDGSLAWTMSPVRRRRHHSAAAPDTFNAPWTPSFFWYNVPPTQGNLFALPDAAAASPCFRWLAVNHQSPTLPSVSAALDYRVRTLDATVACPEAVGMDENEAPSAAVRRSQHASLPRRRRASRPSTPPTSPRDRPKWVVVNKTDVCSLFESLASSMVDNDDDVAQPSASEPSRRAATADDSQSSSTAAGLDAGAGGIGVEPVKWKSTLLRRARAEAQTPQRCSDSSADVALSTNN